MRPATRVLHPEQPYDVATGAIVHPIYLSATFHQEAPGVTQGYDYTRAGNPNFTELESTLAALEQGKYATVFSSGMGALTALIATLKAGDEVVALQGLYGGTYRLFNNVFNNFNVKFTQIAISDLESALKSKPRYLLFETPSNPLLEVYDIEKIAQIAHREGVKVCIDSTFASPVNLNPLSLGVDVVLHSTTKYLGGHADVLGGVLITHSSELKEAFDYARKAIGLNPSPFDTWLTARGVKTLFVRMRAHNENGRRVADFLKGHPLVKKVYYPGYSGMVAAEFNLPLEATKKLVASFKLFSLAESLGYASSLVCHPASMTHVSIPREVRLQTGLADGLVRFSVGIEDPQDLIEDLSQTLKKQDTSL